jgi:beta-mannanase
MFELKAAGETTNDLLANLIEALKEAPDTNFQRWLSNQVDLWSMGKLDWKQDGSDLMQEAEIYYLKAINTHRWGKETYRQDVQYAFKATNSDTETEEEKEKPLVGKYEEMLKALTAQLQETVANSAKWSVNSLLIPRLRPCLGER